MTDSAELYTASYARFDPTTGTAVQISNGRPRHALPYPLRYTVKEAYPAWALVRADNTYDVFREAYRQALDDIGVATFESRFRAITVAEDDPRLVLLCYEAVDKPDRWCHRTMFGEWWTDRTGAPVIELGPQPAVLAEPDPTLFDT